MVITIRIRASVLRSVGNVKSHSSHPDAAPPNAKPVSSGIFISGAGEPADGARLRRWRKTGGDSRKPAVRGAHGGLTGLVAGVRAD